MFILLHTNTACNFFTVAGGLGTVGTFIFMIIDSLKKAKQIDAIQMIQSLQLDALYEPDIRLDSWIYSSTDLVPNEIVIKNHGEYFKVVGIQDLSGLLNSSGMKGWFPYDFEKGDSLHIPLSFPLKEAQGSHDIGITCFNKLGTTYLIRIHIVDGKPHLEVPVKQ